ncbi:hypothetical protein AWB82_04419 [Caballeronia glebae]|uniref:Uncharacterized protein n=1 Tax=Caballeronia glebae TaxID=1777143 RepID=A0A158BQL6_9BURK|nr:hypothetical protein AWB82_04419 [Caballeronia glebae]
MSSPKLPAGDERVSLGQKSQETGDVLIHKSGQESVADYDARQAAPSKKHAHKPVVRDHSKGGSHA